MWAGHIPDGEVVAFQADWNLPSDRLERAVRQVTGSGIGRDQRIFEGHGSEVHDVVTTDGQELIVRIAWRAGPAFDRECWLIEAARAVRIPVPEVLLIDHTNFEDREITIEVQSRIPGSSVFHMLPVLSDRTLADLTIQAGRLLAAVHSIQPPGRGPVGPAGLVDPTLGLPADDLVGSVVDRHDYLLGQGLDRGLVERATAVILDGAESLEQAPLALIHGDWRTTNLITDGSRITGVVDWEGARGGDPALDFVGTWPLEARAASTSMELLRAGYRQAGGRLDQGSERRLLIYRIADLHSALGYFLFRGWPDHLRYAAEDLERLLGDLEATGG